MIRITNQETIKIIKLYKSGIGSDTIAKTFSRSPTGILKLLKRNDVIIRKPKRKLSDKNIKDICTLYQGGLSIPKLASKYNVDPRLISKYLKRNNIKRRNSSECHRIYPINEDFFDNIDTEQKAYFLGLLYADGGNIKSGNFVRIELQKQDKDILQKFAKLIYKEDSEIHIKSYTRTRDIGNGLKEYYSCYLNINSKHICEMLEKHGCSPNKTFKLIFPKWLESELQQHFIRGYFDGDGKIFVNHKKGHGSTFNIASTQNMINNMAEIISYHAGAHFTIYEDKIWILCCCGDKQIENILNWIYNDASIYLNRKYDSYQKIRNRKRARKARFHDSN